MNTTSNQRVQEYRKKLRSLGFRPIQIWVPDTRNPDFLKECIRQSHLVNQTDKLDTQLFSLMDSSLNNISGWK